MTKKEQRKSFRVNATLSGSHSDYLDKKSEESGISKSSLVSIAVDDWIKMEQAKDRWHDELIKKHLQELKENVKKEA